MGQVKGLWLSLLVVGNSDDKPTRFFSEADMQFFYAQDTGALYIATKPADLANDVPVWALAGDSMGGAFALNEDFFGTWAIGDAGPADTWSTTAGAGTGNAAATTVAGSVNGEVTLKSASDDGTHAQNMSTFTAINTGFKANSGGLSWQARVKLDVIATGYLFVGFTDTISTTVEAPIFMNGAVLDSDAANACGIVWDADATTDVLYVGGVKADVDTDPVSSGAVLVAGEYATLRVDVDEDGTVSGYINGELIGTVENAVTVTTALTPAVIVGNRSAAQITATIDWVKAQQNRL